MSNKRTQSIEKGNTEKTLWYIIDYENLAEAWGSFLGKELVILNECM